MNTIIEKRKLFCMKRCKPLLGTYIEISVNQNFVQKGITQEAISEAFLQIEKIHTLMSFHSPQSDLSKINLYSHSEIVAIHPLTARLLKICQDLYQTSRRKFDCNVGHHLIRENLLPKHIQQKLDNIGTIDDIEFVEPCFVRSKRPVCLDFGGIAKGFAVDEAVKVLINHGIQGGVVNAGGDLKVFGKQSQPIYIKSPYDPLKLIFFGEIQDAACATTSNFYHIGNGKISSIYHPKDQRFIQSKQSFSMISKDCVYADALTKVLAICQNVHLPLFKKYSANAYII